MDAAKSTNLYHKQATTASTSAPYGDPVDDQTIHQLIDPFHRQGFAVGSQLFPSLWLWH